MKLFKLAAAPMAMTFVNWGKGKIPYVAIKLYNTDVETNQKVNADLKSKQYREFRGLFTKMVTPSTFDVIKSDIDSLSAFGLTINNSKGLDIIYDFFSREKVKPVVQPGQPIPEPMEPTDLMDPTKPENPASEASPSEENKIETPNPEKLEELKKKFKGALWTQNPIERGKGMTDVITEAMKMLASNATDVLKGGSIMDYLFAKALNKRSFWNQILVLIQKPEANLLKGAVQWLNHGRYIPGYPYKAADIERLKKMGVEIPRLVNSQDAKTKEAIVQCLPKKVDQAITPYDNSALTQASILFLRTNGDVNLKDQAQAEKFLKSVSDTLSTYKSLHKYMRFLRNKITVPSINSVSDLVSALQGKSGSTESFSVSNFEYKPVVYDISDATTLPNWEQATGKKSTEPIKREDWIGRNVGDVDKALVVIEALKDFAKSKDIPVKFEETSKGESGAGGFASPDGITIDSNAQSIIQLGTLVHEITHKLVHFMGEKLNKMNMNIDRVDAETDAEAAKYIVLSQMGYAANNLGSVNYLAVHNSRKFTNMKEMEKHISSRAKMIDGVVTGIVKFIDDYFGHTGNERFIESKLGVKIVRLSENVIRWKII